MGVGEVCVLLFHDLDLPTIYKFIYYQTEADSTHLDPSRKKKVYPISHDRVFLFLIDMKSKANREMKEKVIVSLLESSNIFFFFFFALLRPFKTL